MTGVLVIVGAYLAGAIPFGYLLVRFATGSDVRASGSGNIGATNVLRAAGPRLGAATLLLDIGKGYFAVWAAGRLTGGNLVWMTCAAMAVMAGHAFPIFLRFQGGKAVASFVGAFLCLTPLPVVAVLFVFVIVVARTRYISMGSVLGAGTFPFAVWLISHPPLYVVAAAALGGGFIIYRHKANIERLRAGTENVLRFSRRKAE